MGRRRRAGRRVTEPCASCGSAQMFAVLIPGHADVEAVVCLACGAVQPASENARGGRDC